MLAIILLSGGGGHKYTLIFNNAGQLVPDNQVLIGGSPGRHGRKHRPHRRQPGRSPRSKSNRSCTKGRRRRSAPPRSPASPTTTSRSAPARTAARSWRKARELGLSSTTTPVDIDQLFNTFPPSVRKGLQRVHRRQRGNLRRAGEDGQRRLQILRHRAQPGRRLRRRTERRRSAARPLHRQLEPADDGGRRPRRTALRRGRQRQQGVRIDRLRERRLRPVAATAAAGAAAEQHDLRQPASGARRPRTAGQHGEAGDQGTGAVPGRTAADLPVSWCRSRTTCAIPSEQPGPANDTVDLLQLLPAVQRQASSAFPHAEAGAEAFQPNLNFIRAYTPDLFNGIAKIGQVTGYYDGNGHYARAVDLDAEPLQHNGGTLEPITKSEQYDVVRLLRAGPPPLPGRRDPAGAPTAPTRSSAKAASNPSACNPNDAPPGP